LRRHRGSPEVEPPLGLAALDTLAGRYRAAGLAIEVHVGGQEAPARPSSRRSRAR